ncbi:DUF5996 family protein [Streptomyces sp. NPDC006602]|uniref:DUF5996 family protein n=1 Tax=Streptomyces sp. NPDC006602 TaxID=3364751 RepID=UPI0036B04A16
MRRRRQPTSRPSRSTCPTTRAEPDPRAAVLAFYDSAYRAGAGRANWDVAGLACPGGITDQHLAAPPA